MADNVSSEMFKRMEQRYLYITEQGAMYPGVSADIDPNIMPEWFDKQKFENARKFGSKYLSG